MDYEFLERLFIRLRKYLDIVILVNIIYLEYFPLLLVRLIIINLYFFPALILTGPYTS